jgi:nucleotide-binding universal stress UspA family protein
MDRLMYKRILVPLEHSAYDAAIVEHARKLAAFCGASLVFIHVADGFAARNVNQLNLRESEEMRLDREYLEQTCASVEADGLEADCLLAGGDPSKEIADAAARENCDLIAMSTHGHRFIKDVIYGSVANEVRHLSRVPVLLVRGERRAGERGATPSESMPSSNA